ncbi:MAG: 4Fe-4S binding protein [Butyrivibrio sp.]|nr:4Fe-4S binding protein [Butyrivibrio sp.]
MSFDFSRIAIKNLFSKPATCNYPAEPRKYPERYRGSVKINIDNCIMCGLCQKKCPANAITVDRDGKTWSIERMACVQCESCVVNCPKKCLSMERQYSEPSADKTRDSFVQQTKEEAEA